MMTAKHLIIKWNGQSHLDSRRYQLMMYLLNKMWYIKVECGNDE